MSARSPRPARRDLGTPDLSTPHLSTPMSGYARRRRQGQDLPHATVLPTPAQFGQSNALGCGRPRFRTGHPLLT